MNVFSEDQHQLNPAAPVFESYTTNQYPYQPPEFQEANVNSDEEEKEFDPVDVKVFKKPFNLTVLPSQVNQPEPIFVMHQHQPIRVQEKAKSGLDMRESQQMPYNQMHCSNSNSGNGAEFIPNEPVPVATHWQWKHAPNDGVLEQIQGAHCLQSGRMTGNSMPEVQRFSSGIVDNAGRVSSIVTNGGPVASAQQPVATFNQSKNFIGQSQHPHLNLPVNSSSNQYRQQSAPPAEQVYQNQQQPAAIRRENYRRSGANSGSFDQAQAGGNQPQLQHQFGHYPQTGIHSQQQQAQIGHQQSPNQFHQGSPAHNIQDQSSQVPQGQQSQQTRSLTRQGSLNEHQQNVQVGHAQPNQATVYHRSLSRRGSLDRNRSVPPILTQLDGQYPAGNQLEAGKLAPRRQSNPGSAVKDKADHWIQQNSTTAQTVKKGAPWPVKSARIKVLAKARQDGVEMNSETLKPIHVDTGSESGNGTSGGHDDATAVLQPPVYSQLGSPTKSKPLQGAITSLANGTPKVNSSGPLSSHHSQPKQMSAPIGHPPVQHGQPATPGQPQHVSQPLSSSVSHQQQVQRQQHVVAQQPQVSQINQKSVHQTETVHGKNVRKQQAAVSDNQVPTQHQHQQISGNQQRPGHLILPQVQPKPQSIQLQPPQKPLQLHNNQVQQQAVEVGNQQHQATGAAPQQQSQPPTHQVQIAQNPTQLPLQSTVSQPTQPSSHRTPVQQQRHTAPAQIRPHGAPMHQQQPAQIQQQLHSQVASNQQQPRPASIQHQLKPQQQPLQYQPRPLMVQTEQTGLQPPQHLNSWQSVPNLQPQVPQKPQQRAPSTQHLPQQSQQQPHCWTLLKAAQQPSSLTIQPPSPTAPWANKEWKSVQSPGNEQPPSVPMGQIPHQQQHFGQNKQAAVGVITQDSNGHDSFQTPPTSPIQKRKQLQAGNQTAGTNYQAAPANTTIGKKATPSHGVSFEQDWPDNQTPSGQPNFHPSAPANQNQIPPGSMVLQVGPPVLQQKMKPQAPPVMPKPKMPVGQQPTVQWSSHQNPPVQIQQQQPHQIPQRQTQQPMHPHFLQPQQVSKSQPAWTQMKLTKTNPPNSQSQPTPEFTPKQEPVVKNHIMEKPKQKEFVANLENVLLKPRKNSADMGKVEEKSASEPSDNTCEEFGRVQTSPGVEDGVDNEHLLKPSLIKAQQPKLTAEQVKAMDITIPKMIKNISTVELLSQYAAAWNDADTPVEAEVVRCGLPEHKRPTEADNDTDVENCVKRLQQNDPQLIEINLNNMKRTPIPQIQRLITALKENTHLKKLSLANLGLSDSAMEVLLEVLERNTALEVLNIETNFLTGNFLVRLFQSALVQQTLREVKAVNQSATFSNVQEQEMMKAVYRNRAFVKVSLNLRLTETRSRVEKALIRNGELRRLQRKLEGEGWNFQDYIKQLSNQED